jgi:hypothetical protein
VCGRRRTVIEEELEMLYDAYYEELENYEEEKNQQANNKGATRKPPAKSEENEDESNFNFAKSLTVKGGILTVADDLLKNEGKKFLEMMERLAERRLRRKEEEDDFEEDEDDEYLCFLVNGIYYVIRTLVFCIVVYLLDTQRRNMMTRKTMTRRKMKR